MENPGEHRFDLPSATEPHLKFEQARVLGREAAEHLGGGCDLLGLRSEPPLITCATDCKRTVQLWHGPPPFCGTRPFCQTADAADVRPDTCKTPSWAGPFTPWLGGLGGRLRWSHEERRRPWPLSGRGGFRSDTHYANGTPSRPQGSPFRA